MDERMRFVARLMEGEKMAVLCREFDISRKTGYKLFSRFKNSGIEGLTDRSRRPYRHANQLPFQIENLILQIKEKHSSYECEADDYDQRSQKMHVRLRVRVVSIRDCNHPRLGGTFHLRRAA
jgi:hypothetical protein